MIKRKALLLLMLAILPALLAGCSESPEYPRMAVMYIGDIELETAENSEMRVTFPGEEWDSVADTYPLTVIRADTAATGSPVNITARYIDRFTGKLHEDDMETLLQQMAGVSSYVTVDLAEMRTLDEKPIIYVESTVQMTEEYLDQLIAAGAITEDWLEDVGGREAVLAIPPTMQITIYSATGDSLFCYAGSYYEAEQKAQVAEVMAVIVSTTRRLY